MATLSPSKQRIGRIGGLLIAAVAGLCGCASSHDFAGGRTSFDGVRPGYVEKERAPGVYFIEAHGPVRIFGTIAAANT